MNHADRLLDRLRLVRATRQQQEAACRQSLRARKRDHHDRLTPAEAIELATSLDTLMQRRKAVLKDRKTEVVDRAFGGQVGVKELYRLTLPPGADPAIRSPRLSLKRYTDVVDAIAAVLGEPIDRLRRELLSATSLVPPVDGSDLLHQAEMVADLLQGLIDRLDRRHGWTDLYAKTAQLRLQFGGRVTWPLHPMDAMTDGRVAEERASLDRMALAAVDASQVYFRQADSHWSHLRPQAERHLSGEHLQDDSFFHVPHAPIGHLELWDLPQRTIDAQGHERCRLQWLAHVRQYPQRFGMPADEWSDELQAPQGQASSDQYAYPGFTWLIAYPHKEDPSRTVPALFQAGEEGGAWLMPLDADTLASVADAVWCDGERDAPLVDRLCELLQPAPGAMASPLEAALDRTGPWLAMNPVLAFDLERRRMLETAIQSARAAARRAP